MTGLKRERHRRSGTCGSPSRSLGRATPLRPEPPAEVPPGRRDLPQTRRLDGIGYWSSYYVRSAMSDAPILRASSGQTFYYLTDAEGNVTAITNYDGSTVLERYVYDPYGNVTSYNAKWSGGPSARHSEQHSSMEG